MQNLRTPYRNLLRRQNFINNWLYIGSTDYTFFSNNCITEKNRTICFILKIFPTHYTNNRAIPMQFRLAYILKSLTALQWGSSDDIFSTKWCNSAIYNNMLHTKSFPENLPNEQRNNYYPFNRAWSKTVEGKFSLPLYIYYRLFHW